MMTMTNKNTPLAEQEVADKPKEDLKEIAEKGNRWYLFATGGFFLVLFIIFIFLPRPTFSELEKRDLAHFPDIEDYKENLSGYTAAISQWFSDTEPHRDYFLTTSMSLRNALKFSFRSDEDAVSFIATGDDMADNEEEDFAADFDDEAQTEAHDAKDLIAQNAKVADRGVVVAGTAPNARAMSLYGGGENSGKAFIDLVNKYAATFPNTKVYVVIANTAGEFYMPPQVNRNKPQIATLNNVKANLAPGVNYVDVHSALNNHKAEDLFLRTDHHWAPLGAFYAAKAFAQKANVPFKNLDSYDKHVIHDFVGSMYGYSKDINVKKSPEDFIYYTPKDIEYSAEYIRYSADENFRVTSVSGPSEGPFFKSFNDGSHNAYLTFMGSDQCLVHVKTSSPSKRKLLIIKDSFGNAVPGYLFYSFSDIHVVDCRYFNKNMKKYVADNGITDIAFVLNIFNVCSSQRSAKIDSYLTQADGYTAKGGSSENKAENKAKDKTGDKTSKAKQETDVNKDGATKAASKDQLEKTEEPAPKPEPTKPEPAKPEPAPADPAPES